VVGGPLSMKWLLRGSACTTLCALYAKPIYADNFPVFYGTPDGQGSEAETHPGRNGYGATPVLHSDRMSSREASASAMWVSAAP